MKYMLITGLGVLLASQVAIADKGAPVLVSFDETQPLSCEAKIGAQIKEQLKASKDKNGGELALPAGAKLAQVSLVRERDRAANDYSPSERLNRLNKEIECVPTKTGDKFRLSQETYKYGQTQMRMINNEPLSYDDCHQLRKQRIKSELDYLYSSDYSGVNTTARIRFILNDGKTIKEAIWFAVDSKACEYRDNVAEVLAKVNLDSYETIPNAGVYNPKLKIIRESYKINGEVLEYIKERDSRRPNWLESLKFKPIKTLKLPAREPLYGEEMRIEDKIRDPHVSDPAMYE